MTTQQIMNKFLNGDTKGKASSIRIEGDKLFSLSNSSSRVSRSYIVFI